MTTYNSKIHYNIRSLDGGARYNNAPPAYFLRFAETMPILDDGGVRASVSMQDNAQFNDEAVFVAVPFFYVSGYGILEPLGLVIDFRESNFDILPETRDTSEVVTGVDGEIWFDTRYEKRFFQFVGRSGDGLNAHEKNTFKRLVQNILNQTKSGTKLLMFYDHLEGYDVKYSGSLGVENYPGWLEVDFPLVAYDPHGYSPWGNTHTGSGVIRNRGDMDAEPQIDFVGPASSPVVIINGQIFQYQGNVPAGKTLHVDCKGLTARIETENVLDKWGTDFPVLPPGDNVINTSSNVTITWRDKFN